MLSTGVVNAILQLNRPAAFPTLGIRKAGLMHSNDVFHSFQLQNANIRGSVVRLQSSWADLLEHADYSAPLRRVLGEALAASAMFAGIIKFEGSLSIQLRGAGPLKLLFAECTHAGHLRGIARWDGPSPMRAIELDQPGAQLAITIENKQSDTRHQGLVAVEGGNLASAFEGYFERSEQLPTRIVLAEGAGRCAGLMVQKIASLGGTSASPDVDAWGRVGHLLATLTESELLELPVDTLLLRLFHEEGVLLQPGRPLTFQCSCSRDRVVAMLRSLGPEQAAEAENENEVMEVTCEFCNRNYRFDSVDIAGLFASQPLAPGPLSPQ